MQKTESKGKASIFVIARALDVRRRAQSLCIETRKTPAAPSPATRLVLPGKKSVEMSPKTRNLKLPASPLNKSLTPGLLKLPVSPRGKSPTGSNSGAKSSRNTGSKSPQSSRNFKKAQTDQVAIRKADKAHSIRLRKIDRNAFRCVRSGNIRSEYIWDDEDELGRGGCGVVFLARDRHNPSRQVAIKRVLTRSLAETEMLKEETEMLRKLDHPNVLRLYESFEDGKTVYLVMELCKGGDLFERLRDDRHCTEKYSSEVAAQICGALVHCHDQGICHRDLKPENLLLLSQAEDAPIKVADFGLAKHLDSANASQKVVESFCKGRRKAPRKLKTFAGTLEYMAPEVIRIKDEKSGAAAYYDFRCDAWGLGVIVHMMLTGHWPFKLEDVAAYVAEDVPLPDLDFSAPAHMPPLSTQAQDFIGSCLRADFTKRPYSSDLLKHPFLKARKSVKSENLVPMAKRFSHFAHLSGVKKAALTASVRYLKGFEVEELRKHFELFDVDGDGQVTLNEFISAVGKWPQILAEEFDSAEELFRALDSDGSGQISYTEFLAADSDIKLEAREDLARKAFEAFDQKGDGEITSEDIRRVFGGVRQGTADLEEIGIKNGEAAQFEKFRDHLRSP